MAAKQPEIPEWETSSSPPKKSIFRKPVALQTFDVTKEEEPVTNGELGEGETTVKRTWSDRFMGRSRKQLVISLIAGILLLILILGLGLGLGLSHKSWVNLNTFHPGVL